MGAQASGAAKPPSVASAPLLRSPPVIPTPPAVTSASDAEVDAQIRAELRLLRRVQDRIENRGSGYFIDYSLLRETAVVYSVGVGSDISFDLSVLHACHGCHVHAFDNTPVANQFVAKMLPEWNRKHPQTFKH
jgi:hypothetical protein